MILTCPNCRARYAVDPQKIGAAGRIVQCARCTHRWFEKAAAPGPEMPQAPPPAPEVVIRPTTSGAQLPAIIPPKPAFPWRPMGVAAAAALLVVIAIGAVFVFRDRIAGLLPSEASSPAPTSVASVTPPPNLARPPAPEARPQIEIDITASKIDIVGGRYVVSGQLVNNGTAAGSTSLLRVTFKHNDDVLGERSFPMVEGPLPPGGRVNFSQVLEDPPAGTTDIVPMVE
jgi:predicted Zn finger-like uncharacterized protein